VPRPRRKGSRFLTNDPIGVLDLNDPHDRQMARWLLMELKADEERLMKAKDELDLAESMLRISKARTDAIIAELHRFGYDDEQIEELRKQYREEHLTT
jgi:Holliday junction resolvasome RuvABC DNA-binding subunit